jgi:hypothetical protein
MEVGTETKNLRHKGKDYPLSVRYLIPDFEKAFDKIYPDRNDVYIRHGTYEEKPCVFIGVPVADKYEWTRKVAFLGHIYKKFIRFEFI